MNEGYEVAKELAKKEHAYHLTKIQDKPFSQRARTKHIFNTDHNVYGEDKPIPVRVLSETPVNKFDHDKPFKPSNPPKIGHNKTIAKFPHYMEDPPKELTRMKEEEGADVPKKFKPTHTGKSVPCPSVAVNIRNLKSSFPSVFRK